ncbi:BnaC09g20790D [Brassica napus]|uniref:BnaC09g20790D protein n=1 Tax=Brassica napus TaxID=3708 RepID=A0A078FYP2_BRANA|nr:BnaC09g20790D [Brassica napus]
MEGRRLSRSYSRRRLCLLSSSPSEERWKPTTIDDSRRLDGDSSVFWRQLCRSTPSLFQMALMFYSTSRSTTQVV